MTRRSLLHSALALAGLGVAKIEAAAPMPYIEGPCCLVTESGAYLHFKCFGDAVRAAMHTPGVVRVCPASEYWDLVEQMMLANRESLGTWQNFKSAV